MARIYMGGGTGDVEVPAGGGAPPPAPSGLLATYYADNGASDVVFNSGFPPGPSTIATIPGVVVGAGQRVVVHATVWVENSVDSLATADIQILEDSAVIDETMENIEFASIGASSATITRVFRWTPTPGTHTYSLIGNGGNFGQLKVPGTGSTPNATPGGRLTVEVVNV